MADVGLVPSFVSCEIMASIEGSDHCPVRAEFDVCVMPARKCPPLCTKYLPQFAGRQQTLATFFGKKIVKQCELSRSSSQDESQTQSQDDTRYSSSQHSSASVTSSSSLDTAESPASSTQPGKHCAVIDTFSGSDSSGAVSTKRLKLSDNSLSGGNKQRSLLTFFNKPSLPDSTCREPTMTVVSDTNSVGLTLKPRNGSLSQELTDTDAKRCGDDTASKWKMLLKGPPQPPLCKGHKEPCVLRTVKKDGPNKGKQFWVCCRPDGPKNNSDARCDHFVWISNKQC